MTEVVQSRLNGLRAEYEARTGRSFEDFFCPILWRDEPGEVCEGHVINAAFADSDRMTVIQRRDVDNFFGAHFEAAFVLLQQRGQHTATDILLNRRLSRWFRPKFSVDGTPVEHYLPKGRVPPSHSELVVEREGLPPDRLALKVTPSEMLTAVGADWQLALEKDVRLPALVSLLKAAHLTLFGLMGYSYALTTAGRFVGWDILGSFVYEAIEFGRTNVMERAATHFPQFAALVRPMKTSPSGLKGTITDGQLFLCTGSLTPWALMVFVRTGDSMHAVLLPVMEDDESTARFLRFMSAPSPRFEIRLARFAGDRWEVATNTRTIDWPAGQLDGPLAPAV